MLLVVALAAPLAAQPNPPSTDLNQVFEELVCQCGCNLVLSTCAMESCHSATPMRKEIQKKIAAGETKEAIVAGFVEQYGMKVLSAPPARGFHLSAWVMPFAVLLAGAFIAQKVLAGWRKKTAGKRGAIDRPAISQEERERIERDLEDFEA